MSLPPIRKRACATCPFRLDSPYRALVPALIASATSQRESRICHSTGEDNAINRNTGVPPQVCRGARDVQLDWLYALGYVDSPTDEAYAKRCRELGIEAPESV